MGPDLPALTILTVLIVDFGVLVEDWCFTQELSCKNRKAEYGRGGGEGSRRGVERLHTIQ